MDPSPHSLARTGEHCTVCEKDLILESYNLTTKIEDNFNFMFTANIKEYSYLSLRSTCNSSRVRESNTQDRLATPGEDVAIV